MSENKHQLMLRDLRRIDTALFNLSSTISFDADIDVIKHQASLVEVALNRTMATICAELQKEGVVWDSILLGIVQFFNDVIFMSENDLKHAMVRNEIPLDSKEIVH